MARVMYIEAAAGVAGDMLLGAFLDAGLPLDALRTALGSLSVDHDLRVSRVVRAGVSASYVQVVPRGQPASGGPAADRHVHPHAHAHTHDEAHSRANADRDDGARSQGASSHEHAAVHGHDHPHGSTAHEHGAAHAHGHADEPPRNLDDIRRSIATSSLSADAKARAIALFERLGAAEAAVHGVPVADIHFHEVGAVDSIVDIAGCVFAMEWFGIDDVVASPINVGGGTVEIAHGIFPVPAPATLTLLQGVPIYSAGPRKELTTPTGALVVSGYARAYGPVPAMQVARAGYGAGTRDFPGMPNVVRVLIGERSDAVPLDGDGTVLRVECEIDDMNPQLFGSASERLFEAGALDVFLTAVQMKKGRPGTLVTVLAPEGTRRAICDVLFTETTTLGVRVERVAREMLQRRWELVAVAGGSVRVKIGERDGRVFNAVPEFDDCDRVARATGRPVKDVQADALAAWRHSR